MKISATVHPFHGNFTDINVLIRFCTGIYIEIYS